MVMAQCHQLPLGQGRTMFHMYVGGYLEICLNNNFRIIYIISQVFELYITQYGANHLDKLSA